MNIVIFFHTGLLYTPEVFSLFNNVWGLGNWGGGESVGGWYIKIDSPQSSILDP